MDSQMLTLILHQKLSNKNSQKRKTYNKSKRSSLSAVVKGVSARVQLQSMLQLHLKIKDSKLVFLMLIFMDHHFLP